MQGAYGNDGNDTAQPFGPFESLDFSSFHLPSSILLPLTIAPG